METTKWKPNDEQRLILIKLKEASQPNEGEFAREFTIYSPSNWSKILAAIDPDRPTSYFDELKNESGRTKLVGELADLLARVPRLKAERMKRISKDIHPIKPFQAVARAVRECKGKEGPERIVLVKSSTGGGKTTLRAWLQNEFAGELDVAAVECRNSWRPASTELRYRTMVAVMTDIYSALGMRLTVRRRSDLVAQEDALIERLNERWTVLFIDEAEYFGKYALDTIKLLLNKTARLIVVIACTPRAFDAWSNYYPDQADQISRRIHATVSTDIIKPEDAALFFAEKQFENPAKALDFIAGEASRFGHFSLIKRIGDILEKSVRAEKKEVEDAVEKALKQMSKQRTLATVAR